MNTQSRPQGNPAGHASWPSPSAAAGNAPAGRADFVVLLHEQECRLSLHELSELRRWIQAWWRDDRDQYLLMGCSAESGRQCRRHRLQALREQLAECGLNPEDIRPTDDWSTPAWQEPAPHMPTELVWMKAVDLRSLPSSAQAINALASRRDAH